MLSNCALLFPFIAQPMNNFANNTQQLQPLILKQQQQQSSSTLTSTSKSHLDQQKQLEPLTSTTTTQKQQQPQHNVSSSTFIHSSLMNGSRSSSNGVSSIYSSYHPHFLSQLQYQIQIQHQQQQKQKQAKQIQIQVQVEEKEEEIREEKWWHSTVSGVVGGTFCVYAGQPFDTIKVRLQTQSSTQRAYSSTFDCFQKTISQGGGGIKGYSSLYKGASPALASVILENSVLFTANGFIKQHLFDRTTTVNGGEERELTLGEEALAGGLSGFFSSTAITPAEFVKCKLQVQETASGLNKKYSGPLDVISKTIRKEGIKGVFSGLPTVWMRDIPFNFVFLGSYEAYCSLLSWQQNSSREDLTFSRMFLAGGFAGVTGWSIVFPMDVIKSKIQTNSSPIISSISNNNSKSKIVSIILNTFKQEGIKGFYRGWSAAVMRAFPANAALLLGVEVSKNLLSSS